MENSSNSTDLVSVKRVDITNIRSIISLIIFISKNELIGL